MKKTNLVFLMLAVGCIFFLLGRYIGEKVSNLKHQKQNYYLSNANSLGSYTSLADISNLISSAKIDQAKCIADVAASAHIDVIKVCLSQQECHDFMYELIQKDAPELLEAQNKKIQYYKRK
jgi:hypothetical protein